jgi:hypothetical protein
MSGFLGTKQDWKRCMQKQKLWLKESEIVRCCEDLLPSMWGNVRWNEESVWKVQTFLTWRLCQINWFRLLFLRSVMHVHASKWVLVDVYLVSMLQICYPIITSLDDRGFRVGVPVGWTIFSSPRHPKELWGAPNLYWDSFPAGKMAGVWSSPPIIAYTLSPIHVFMA